MALHPNFPESPYAILDPVVRWFPAGEALRESSMDKVMPPLVPELRRKVKEWRGDADIVLGCLRYEIQGIGSIARRKGSCRYPKGKVDHGHGSGEETRRRSKGRARRQARVVR